MSTIRDALRIRDSRLTAAVAVVLLLLTTDFFSRVVLFSPDSSRPVIEEVKAQSDAIPQIGQTQLDSYLANIAGLIEVPAQAGAIQLSDDLVAQRPATNSTDRLWRTEGFSYKLIALVENAERFAVLYSVDNATGVREVLEIRQGESIAGYTVSDLLSKEVRLTSNKGDQVTLTLFEPEESQD
jgi:hypothetical protein